MRYSVAKPNALIEGSLRPDTPACTMCAARLLARRHLTKGGTDRKTPVYVRRFSFGPCLDFLGVIELWARHLSATIPLRVPLFLSRSLPRAARTSFS